MTGFLTYSTWAWNIACARDVFSWGFAFALLNLGQSLHVLYQNRPVRTDKELETVYKNLFRPLNVRYASVLVDVLQTLALYLSMFQGYFVENTFFHVV